AGPGAESIRFRGFHGRVEPSNRDAWTTAATLSTLHRRELFAELGRLVLLSLVPAAHRDALLQAAESAGRPHPRQTDFRHGRAEVGLVDPGRSFGRSSESE